MSGLLLRLLLILALVLDGMGAPLALAHGQPAPPAAGAFAAQDADTSRPASGCSDHHGGPQAAAASTEHFPVTVPPPVGDDLQHTCCDGPACDCGCVLPPFVPAVAVFARFDPPAVLAVAGSLPMAGAVHSRPPYRPPAG